MRKLRSFPALLASAGLLAGCGGGDPDALIRARRGDLEIVLRLRGTLRPVREQNIKSPRWGEITRMAPNGSTVKAGQVVLELDSESVEESIREHQADVDVRTAELKQAEKEVEKSRRYSRLKHAIARLNRELEASRLKELKARPTKRELSDAGGKLEFAGALVQAAERSVALTRELVEAGYAPGDELRSAELELVRAGADQAAARAALEKVRAGPSASELQAAAIRVEQARLGEKSAGKNIQIVKEWADSKLARFSRTLEREREKLSEARRRMSEYRAVAPNDGVVLHATRRWGGMWQPGRHAYGGATIMSIPDLSRMKIIIQVPAYSVRQLEVLGEAPARVRVRALPGKDFNGKLTRISAIGRDEFEGLDPSISAKLGRAERQVFEAEVEIDEEDPRLKPGFSAEAELILRRVKNAIIVPRMALAASGRGSSGSARVYVKSGGGFEERKVRVLAANKFEAAIEGPVKEGDLLWPGRPPEFSPAHAGPAAGKKPLGPAPGLTTSPRKEAAGEGRDRPRGRGARGGAHRGRPGR